MVMFRERPDGSFATFMNRGHRKRLMEIDPDAKYFREFQEFARFTPNYKLGRWSGYYDIIQFSDRRRAILYKLALT